MVVDDLEAAQQMDESSIAWVDGAVLTIDQRALPHELRQLWMTTVDEVIDAIKSLAIRGPRRSGWPGRSGWRWRRTPMAAIP